MPGALSNCSVYFPILVGMEAPLSVHLKEEEDQPIDDGGACAVDQHRPGDGKHLCADAHDIAFAFELHRRGDNRIRKAGDRHQRARPGVLCNLVVDF